MSPHSACNLQPHGPSPSATVFVAIFVKSGLFSFLIVANCPHMSWEITPKQCWRQDFITSSVHTSSFPALHLFLMIVCIHMYFHSYSYMFLLLSYIYLWFINQVDWRTAFLQCILHVVQGVCFISWPPKHSTHYNQHNNSLIETYIYYFNWGSNTSVLYYLHAHIFTISGHLGTCHCQKIDTGVQKAIINDMVSLLIVLLAASLVTRRCSP